MDEPATDPSAEELSTYVERAATEDALAYLRALGADDDETRTAALRALRTVADDRPAALAPLVPGIEPFLEDEKRSIRLSTAKLFVAVAAAAPESVREAVPALAARLKDDGEFYYVRARVAEALGYVALEEPDVATPAVLAELRVGLEIDEPEVKRKLAKALAHVALGDPDRLRHRVSDLAGHLDDEQELVRYHLCTALVAVGCERPAKLLSAADALAARLEDDSEHVRGRAAEALGLLARETNASELPVDALEVVADDEASFAAERARFALAGVDGAGLDEGIGSLAAIRERTDEIVAEMGAPDGECPGCGLALPENGPPTCPRCGAPYRR
ncbi:MAG: HEAT repeat domain-containing protein [Halalkalicoccus sp.]